MDLLSEMPLDYLGQSLAAAAAAGSILALSLALAAAALGFWRMQAAKANHTLIMDNVTEPCIKSTPPVVNDVSVPQSTGSSSSLCDSEFLGTPRARFTTYYSYEALAVEEDIAEEEAEEEDAEAVDDGVFVKRRWELGWNRIEELTEFSGTVVRLWGCDGAASPRGLRREFRYRTGVVPFC